MKAKELIENAIKLCGHRYYSVVRRDVHYKTGGESGEVETKYSLCLQPGVDGTDCQHVYGESIEDLAEKIGELVADKMMSSGGGTDDDDEPAKPINPDGYKDMPQQQSA